MSQLDVARLWKSGGLSDVKLQLRDRTFEAHKVILCSQSSMLRRIIGRLNDAAIFPDGDISEVFLEAIHKERFDRDRNYSLMGNIIFALRAYQAGQKSGSPRLTAAAVLNFKVLLGFSRRDGFVRGDAFEHFVELVYNKSTNKSTCIHPQRDENGLRKYFIELYSPRMSSYLSRAQMDRLLRWIPDFAVDYTFSFQSQSWGVPLASNHASAHARIFARPSRCTSRGPCLLGEESERSYDSDDSEDSEDSNEYTDDN